MVPLGPESTEVIVNHYLGDGHRGAREHIRRLLNHLLKRVSVLFEEQPISDLSIGVCLHENSYTVTDASFVTPHALHIPKKLDAHAHDRRSEEYRPAGRQ